jgi:NADH:ubiquinone oxidoreductase subunit F (NADH-binding)
MTAAAVAGGSPGTAVAVPVDPLPAYGTLGDPQTRLLAGPAAIGGPESLDAHLARLGPLELPSDAGGVLELVRASGLVGRGGGEFPVAAKLAAAAGAGGSPVVVVNGSEGEPASRKDTTLVEHRPHLVLDGAEVAARAVGAASVIVYVHASRARAWSALRRAVGERNARSPAITVHMVEAPDTYVAGESGAVVSFLDGGAALPRRRQVPVAVRGVQGRPTVVSNVESMSHLALLARFGAGWFTMAGSPGAPGSSLLTLGGGVASPGLVVEILAPVRLGDVLRSHGALDTAPGAVLIGGYGGRWVGGDAAVDSPLDRAALRRAGVRLGCGLVAPLPAASCGLAVTARLLDYLASQSAGQCGPCVFGLAELAGELAAVVDGRATRGDLRRLSWKAAALRGRGDCAHPDGAVELLESALEVFGDDAARHARGRPCGGNAGGWFPVGPHDRRGEDA